MECALGQLGLAVLKWGISSWEISCLVSEWEFSYILFTLIFMSVVTGL